LRQGRERRERQREQRSIAAVAIALVHGTRAEPPGQRTIRGSVARRCGRLVTATRPARAHGQSLPPPCQQRPKPAREAGLWDEPAGTRLRCRLVARCKVWPLTPFLRQRQTSSPYWAEEYDWRKCEEKLKALRRGDNACAGSCAAAAERRPQLAQKVVEDRL
jgi:hypothetical protein